MFSEEIGSGNYDCWDEQRFDWWDDGASEGLKEKIPENEEDGSICEVLDSWSVLGFVLFRWLVSHCGIYYRDYVLLFIQADLNFIALSKSPDISLKLWFINILPNNFQ